MNIKKNPAPMLKTGTGLFIMLVTVFVTFISSPVKAENVFMKDGSILADVKIVSESADSVTVTTSEKSKKKILRKDILRINNINLSTRKIPVYDRDWYPFSEAGLDFEAYLVDKNDTIYTFRNDLYKPEEFTEKKSDLWMLPDRTVAELKAEGKIRTTVSFDLYSMVALIGSFSGLLLAFLLFKIKRGNRVANKFLALYLVSAALSNCYGVYSTNLLYIFPKIVDLYIAVPYLCAPLIYWYVLKLTRPEFKFKFVHMLHLVPFIMAVLYLYQHSIFISTEEMILLNYYYIPHPLDVFVFEGYLMPMTVYLFFIIKMLRSHTRWIRQEFSSINNNVSLSWLGFLIYGNFTIFVILLSCYILDFKSMGYSTDFNVMIKIWPFFYSVFIFTMGYKGLMQHEIFTDPRTVPAEIPAASEEKPSLPPDKIREITDKLTPVMNTAQPYLDPDLTLPMLADMVNVPRNYLSLAINEGMGQNFYDFINSYRVSEVKKQLEDPGNHEINLLNLAFGSGFNSKATFNSVFKKNTGMTPSEYKKHISFKDAESKAAPAEDYV